MNHNHLHSEWRWSYVIEFGTDNQMNSPKCWISTQQIDGLMSRILRKSGSQIGIVHHATADCLKQDLRTIFNSTRLRRRSLFPGRCISDVATCFETETLPYLEQWLVAKPLSWPHCCDIYEQKRPRKKLLTRILSELPILLLIHGTNRWKKTCTETNL